MESGNVASEVGSREISQEDHSDKGKETTKSTRSPATKAIIAKATTVCSKKQQLKSDVDLELLREAMKVNPFQYQKRHRTATYQKIASYLNKKIATPDSRTARYVRDRLKQLLNKWKSQDRNEARATGGGGVPDPTEKDSLLKDLAEEEEKGYMVASSESEKKTENARVVEGIQEKALMLLRNKRDISEESDNAFHPDYIWRKQCEQLEKEHDESFAVKTDAEIITLDEENESGPSVSVKTERENALAAKTTRTNPSCAVKRVNRGTLADRLVKEKTTAESQWRAKELAARKENLLLELEDKKEERALREKQLIFDAKKAEMDHILNMERIRLEQERETRRMELEKADKDRLFTMINTMLNRGSGPAPSAIHDFINHT